MATPLAFTAEYPHAAAAVRAALRDERYWRDRISEVGGPDATVDAFGLDGDVLRVELTQRILPADLPGPVAAALPHGLVIRRSETYSGTGGSFRAVVDDAPAQVAGTVTLADREGGAAAAIAGSVEVAVPLYGRKIEAAVAANLRDLLAAESEFTSRWIAEHPEIF